MRETATLENPDVTAYEFVILRVGEEPIFFRPKTSRLVLGRDTSCEITLTSPAISRQHAKLHFEDGCWQAIDLGSANGTFLGDEALQPRITTIWKSGVPLRVGPFTIQQHRAHEAGKTPTLFLQPLNEISRGISHFVVTLDHETITLQPKQRKTAQLTLKNHSDETVRLKITIRNLPDEWYEISNEELLLYPNTRKQTLLRFELPEGVERGIHPFEIDVQDAAGSNEKVTAYGMLDVTQQVFHAFSAELNYRKGRLFLDLANTGNTDDAYKFSSQPAPNCSIIGHQWSSILKADQRDSIQFNVKLQRHLIGMVSEQPIVISIRSNSGVERQAQTIVPIAPIIPLWIVAAGVGLLVLLATLGALLGWF